LFQKKTIYPIKKELDEVDGKKKIPTLIKEERGTK